MPTYHYHCDACEAEFEKEQRISEKPLKKCVKCGKNKARRMIVSGNFILKGGGWYSDGYGSPSKSKPEPKSESGASSTSDKSDKPAKKTESSASAAE